MCSSKLIHSRKAPSALMLFDCHIQLGGGSQQSLCPSLINIVLKLYSVGCGCTCSERTDLS